MPTQIYYANVSYGANTTTYFQVLANTYQDAAQQAVERYEANAAIALPNGDIRFANPNGAKTPIGNSTGRRATVYVRDPSITEANKSYEIIVSSVSLPLTSQVYGQYSVISTVRVPNQY
jgi:hypothetical protein